MNCKNCGAPVDGHIACPKCGQLVDFTSQTSYTPRTNYGISWGAEEEKTPTVEPKVEPVKETTVEPVKETPVEPVVEKKEEPRLDTSDISDAIKPSYTYDDIKKEKEPEPYKYKENKYEYKDADSYEAKRRLTDFASRGTDDSSAVKVAFSVFFMIAALCVGVSKIGDNSNTSDLDRARQDIYNNLDQDTIDRLTNIYGYSSSSTTDVEEEPTVYVYADLGKIYNSDGQKIDISEDAIVESAYYHQRIAYIEDDKLYLVDGDLDPDKIADGVKDFQISSKGEYLAYINQNDYLIYRKYDTSYDVYNVGTGVDSFVFSDSGSDVGFLYVKANDDGKAIYQCDKNGDDRVKISDGECTPLDVSPELDCAFYLDENNHLHRYLSNSDSDTEYDITINDNSEYIFSGKHDAILVNNISVDGKIYSVNKYTDEMVTIDKPGLCRADICDATYGLPGGLVATYLCNDGLIEVKFDPSGIAENLITDSANVECFATDLNGEVVLYKQDNKLYGWFRKSYSSDLIDEDASAINNILVANTREFYYLKGNELDYIYPTSTALVPVLITDDVDKIVKYIDNDGQVTIGFARTDYTRCILTTMGNYIRILS